jgi:phosphoglycerol transferase MdoB-like AlkP superfamily enzyme
VNQLKPQRLTMFSSDRSFFQHYISLGAKLAIALGLLSVSRILFYLFNIQMFPEVSAGHIILIIITGLRFDLSALLMVNGVFILLNILPFSFIRNRIYRKVANIIFILTNTIALIPNFADVIYYRFTHKRTTGDIFNYLSVNNDLGTQFPQFVKDFWFIFLFWFASIALLIWICRRMKPVSDYSYNSKKFPRGTAWFVFAVASILTIVGIRGGVQLKPISIITAGKYTSANNIPLVLNSPFTIIKTINQEALPKMHYFTDDFEAETIYPVVHNFSGDSGPMLTGVGEKPNVVIIVLESFSEEHIGALNKNSPSGYEGFTPFLDSLIGQSLVVDGFANGKRSIEGIPAILSGIPALMNQDFITSVYAGNKFNSLASLLHEVGYTSSFYHGGSNGTMGFDAYARSAGFEYYYGRTEYANEADYDGQWGIWDEPYLQYFASNLNKTKEPFLSAVFTLSSHHPYQVPAKYKNKFREGNLKIQRSIMYTDFALERFFTTASKMPWFDRTIFVITADHTSESWIPYYRTRPGSYAIPILFYRNNSSLKGKLSITVQQTDILPSILDYLHFPSTFISFGQSVFQQKSPHLDVTYLNNSWQLIMNGNSLEWDGEKTTSFYHYQSDSLAKNNLASQKSQDQVKMELYLQAIIQQYNNRMSANQLTIPK